MSSEGPNGLATWSNNTLVGAVPWGSPENMVADDASISQAAALGTTQFFLEVKLVVGGVVSGSNFTNGTVAMPTTDSFTTFGGESSAGGLSLTGADVKAANFGFVFQIDGDVVDSNYLQGLNAAFATIPDAAIVTGFTIEVKARRVTSHARGNFARITVHYTDPPASIKSGAGMLMCGVG